MMALTSSAPSPQTNVNGPFNFQYNSDPEYTVASLPFQAWPGSYSSNMFYDMQDVFDTAKSGPGFSNRLAIAGGVGSWFRYPNDTNRTVYDRYTFQRMLASMGTGSEPEYGVFVYPDGIANAPGQLPTLYRTKLNLNYDNSSQIAQGPYTPMPTNLVSWTDPLKFFTNAAELLLRTQDFPVLTNAADPNSVGYVHFGLSSMFTNYPIYDPTNLSYRYTSQLHRMLQLAANLYQGLHWNQHYWDQYRLLSGGVPADLLPIQQPALYLGLLARHVE